ncbi:hypothetical protein ACHAXS_009717 [Conticribra weissflogii]
MATTTSSSNVIGTTPATTTTATNTSTLNSVKSSVSNNSNSKQKLNLSIDSIFVGKDFRSESYSQPRWWDSGSCYTALVRSGSVKPSSSSSGVDAAPSNGINNAVGSSGAIIGGIGTRSAPSSGNLNFNVKSSANGNNATSPLNLSPIAANPNYRDLIWHDVATNTTSVYVSSSLLIPPGHDAPLVIDDYALSPDKSRLLIFTNAQKVWRKKTRGDYWVLDITARDLRQLGISSDGVEGSGGSSGSGGGGTGGVVSGIGSGVHGRGKGGRSKSNGNRGSGNGGADNSKYNAPPASLMFATFSPAGDKVAYLSNNNLYVQDLHTFRITPLTVDGSSTIINGTFDWVYEEEFRLRKGFSWSPDGKRIAFWQLNQEGVRVVNLVNNTDHLYPVVMGIPYPKAGEVNCACRIGVVEVEHGEDDDEEDHSSREEDVGGTEDFSGAITKRRRPRETNDEENDSSPPITWIHIPGDSRNHYITSLDWIPNNNNNNNNHNNDKSLLVFQRLNRLQNTLHIITADPTAHQHAHSHGHSHQPHGSSSSSSSRSHHNSKLTCTFIDRDEAWIDLPAATWTGEESSGIKFVDEGKKFLWLSERNGWRQLFLVERVVHGGSGSGGSGGIARVGRIDGNGGGVWELTERGFDVLEIAGVDEDENGSGGWVYYIASPGDPLRRYLYRSRMDYATTTSVTIDEPTATNTEDVTSNSFKIPPHERITPQTMPGTHSYRFSHDGKYAIHVYSAFTSPETTDIVRMPDHKTIHILADNREVRERISNGGLPEPEFFRVPITVNDGYENETNSNSTNEASNDKESNLELDAYILHPPNFDHTKKYPVLFYVYGEPAMQVVRDIWGGRTSLWHMMLAQQNYVVCSIDNRGTPSPRGRAWRKCVYRKIGIIAPSDQAKATQAILKSRPYLDSNRVAIWGWSGGGSMSLNAIFRYPNLYHTAMSIAPVPNQRVYDTIYQERYMGLPSDNVEGFRDGSPITHAKNLKGNLLIVHGTGDDNCHYAGTEALINELILHNKQFSMMAYPNRSHSISEGVNTTRHLFTLLTNFLRRNVPNDVLDVEGKGDS